MDNALNNDNLNNQGQINDNVGQDENQTQNEGSSSDWESQAKYFQSEKDKLHTENQKLKQYEQVGKMLESRPDIVQTISGMVQGGQPATQPERIALDKDEFDPWEAYNDPASKSYKFRQQELQDTINTAVEGQMAGVQKQVGMNELKSELQAKGLNDQEINSFFDFASKNPSEYGVDGAINMWKAVTGEQPAQQENINNPLDSIRQNQSVPQQAGILTGEQPIRKDEKDSMWEGILKAGSRANVL
tara:strand:+ start:202 stop:936 length:735 start_codon:yes stop_codon:yes gene_type:complete